MASISGDGRGASPPGRPASFLILDPSGVINDALTETMLSQQADLLITKDIQQVTDEISRFSPEHRTIVIYIEEIDQLFSMLKSLPETASLTYILLMSDKKKEGKTLADLFSSGRLH